MKKKFNYSLFADATLFASLLIVFSVFLYRLVVHQAIYAGRIDGYPSDIVAYIMEIEGNNTEYNFAYPLFFLTGRFFLMFVPIGQAVAFSVVLYNGLTLVLTKYYLEKKIVLSGIVSDRWYVHMLISLVAVSCSIMAMWWLPRFGKLKLYHKEQAYFGTFSGNPWHNATYVATKPFSVIAFFSFSDLLSAYEKKIDIRNALLFSVSLLLSAIAKPTFNLVFISAAGLVLLVRLIKAKFKNFKHTISLGLCFVPTFVVMLIQYADMFVPKTVDDVQGIRFTWFEVWKLQNTHVVAAVFYANVFSIVCLVFFAKDIIKDTTYRFAILFFVISFLEAGLLCERGERFSHFNFSWGYMHGVFLLQTVTTIKLIIATFTKRSKWFLLLLMWLALISQIIAGIFYFRGLYYGRDYRSLLPMSWT